MVVSQKFMPRALAEALNRALGGDHVFTDDGRRRQAQGLRGAGSRRGVTWLRRGVVHPRRGQSARVSLETPTTAPEPTLPTTNWPSLTNIGAPPTTCRSGRSTCWTTRCFTEPLSAEHVKPRLLGHWGTTPGLNLIYAHLNRIIRNRDASVIYVTGPGHGGPGWSPTPTSKAPTARCTPASSEDTEGLRKLFRQFSFPGGIPSHVAAQTPGSIHEGGELGYALVHAYGAAFDNPDLVVACVIGDGEAETGPLAASWHSNKFLNPVIDGAVLPILHLNGYKIANPTVLARIPHAELEALLRGYGYRPITVAGDDPANVHQQLAAALDDAFDDIAAIQSAARSGEQTERPVWPMIVLRTPKGWTGPKVVDGKQVEGTWRAHQVPLAETHDNPAHRAQLEEWLRSYRPEELFDGHGALRPELRALAPRGDRRMSANPHANGGLLLHDLDLPDFRDYAVPVPQPAQRNP